MLDVDNRNVMAWKQFKNIHLAVENIKTSTAYTVAFMKRPILRSTSQFYVYVEQI